MALDQCYSIQQLATHARVSVSTVRHYINMGEVPKCFGSRTRPIYTNAHLSALMRTRRGLEGNVRLGHIAESAPFPAHTIKVSTP